MQRLDASLQEVSEEDSRSASSNIEKSSGTDASGNGSTTESRRTGTSEEDAQHIKNALARQETKQVFRLRVLVILVLFAAAASISASIYMIIQNANMEEYQLQYEGTANKLVDSLQDVLAEMAAISGIAVATTADVLQFYSNSNESWPFVTMSNFQQRAGSARRISGAIYVSINPIVQSNKLSDWERYVLSDANSWMYVICVFSRWRGSDRCMEPCMYVSCNFPGTMRTNSNEFPLDSHLGFNHTPAWRTFLQHLVRKAYSFKRKRI
jgi:hypothetical protein